MLHRLAFPAALLLGCALTACQTDGPAPATPAPTTSATPTSAVDADDLRAGIAALYSGADPAPEESAESECFTDALLDRLDADALAAAGIVEGGAVVDVLPVLDVATAEAWVDAQDSCADFVEVSTRAVGAQSKGKVDAEAYAACLREAIAADDVRAALVNTLSGRFDSPEVTALGEAQAGCVRSASPPE